MSAPAALYAGRIMHARLGAVPHRFTYRVLSVLVDLRELSAASRMARLLSIDRFNLLSIHQRDHGPRERPPAHTLARSIEALATSHGVDASGRILMLAFPRVFGHVFNPLTVYFLNTAKDRPSAVVYEVRNTFGGMHHYVCPVSNGTMSPAGIRHSAGKSFYVSPFQTMEQRYDFRVKLPQETASVRILQHGEEGPRLGATFFGERLAVTDRNIVRALRATRMSSLKVLGGIHYEALRLYMKGARFHAAPEPTK